MEQTTIVVDSFVDQMQNDSEMRAYFLNDARSSVDDDLYFYEEGVFLAIYREDGKRCTGNFISREEDQIAFEDYQMREVTIEKEECAVYDRKIGTGEEIVWIRGVSYIDFGWVYIFSTIKTLILVVPVILILALIGGYCLAKGFLKPITQIANTAEKIRQGGNLSTRIEIRNNGDELTQLAETFNRMFERLQKNFEAEQQFTSNASHELRTPIAVIQAQCEYAIENVENPEELWEVIATIQKQGYRMSKLIETLLIFTRIEQKTEKYAMKEENISEIVSEICEDRKLMLEKNIDLQMEIQPNVKKMVNRELLCLLVNNLLQNSYRYGKENGTVLVSVKEENQHVIIRVRDDGIGITKEQLPHIWERFYRVDQSRSKKGMGLGLSLVKQITQYHGGKIEVSSKEGEGSEFRVIL